MRENEISLHKLSVGNAHMLRRTPRSSGATPSVFQQDLVFLHFI